jgi:hypothetical protein
MSDYMANVLLGSADEHVWDVAVNETPALITILEELLQDGPAEDD